ncbi:hypothetical protein NDU88_001831 [Pleurodeles waltl]|uniref:Uncharacterized protein n=1 Tax=Pleurodeles waltl TaxID=8319 RepID=A0AAV7LE07_PLEWA|nr:hypothetical protein NDU88_001831 [Pleurodeles waltl]
MRRVASRRDYPSYSQQVSPEGIPGSDRAGRAQWVRSATRVLLSSGPRPPSEGSHYLCGAASGPPGGTRLPPAHEQRGAGVSRGDQGHDGQLPSPAASRLQRCGTRPTAVMAQACLSCASLSGVFRPGPHHGASSLGQLRRRPSHRPRVCAQFIERPGLPAW